MSELTAVIVDDEQHCREGLKGLLARKHSDVVLAGEATNVPEGIALLAGISPKVLFLDIEMGDHTGFDLLQALGPDRPHVIFTTAHEGYAVKAIRFSALDYLLKPVDPEELASAIGKVKQALRKPQSPDQFMALLQNLSGQDKPDAPIAVPTASGPIKIAPSKIVTCQSHEHGTQVNTADQGPIQVDRDLHVFADMLDDKDFLRLQPDILANIRHVEKRPVGADNTVVMSDGTRIQISPVRKKQLLERLDAR